MNQPRKDLPPDPAHAPALTASEVRRALDRGLFTVTRETARGYYVTVFAKRAGGAGVVQIADSKECVRPQTARRYAAALVRTVLSDLSRKAGAK